MTFFCIDCNLYILYNDSHDMDRRAIRDRMSDMLYRCDIRKKWTLLIKALRLLKVQYRWLKFQPYNTSVCLILKKPAPPLSGDARAALTFVLNWYQSTNAICRPTFKKATHALVRQREAILSHGRPPAVTTTLSPVVLARAGADVLLSASRYPGTSERSSITILEVRRVELRSTKSQLETTTCLSDC